MKRFIYCLFAFVVTFLTACGGKSDSEFKTYGDTVHNDTLRVCVDCALADLSRSIDQEYENRKFFQTLAEEIKASCGIEQIAFEVLPQRGAERETTLQRLRTEIMAGGGPDVFLMNNVLGVPEQIGVQRSYALFNFPEKSMELGLFLPLDEYMENRTQFTDWSAQTKTVMDAGCTDEGQVIIPLTYTFPIYLFQKEDVKLQQSSSLTMQEILNDAETAEIGAALYSDLDQTDGTGSRKTKVDRLFFTLGKYADHKNEELLFTEEELFETVNTVMNLRDDVEKNTLTYFEYTYYFSLMKDLRLDKFDTDVCMVPLYSIDGGVTASVHSFAAVNRNTNFPEEAFSVIDYIMQEDMQRKSELYYSYFGALSLPMQNDLGQEGKSLNARGTSESYLPEPYFEDLLAIKANITAVNFQSELDTYLLQLMYDCQANGFVSHEDVAEAYEQMKRRIGE